MTNVLNIAVEYDIVCRPSLALLECCRLPTAAMPSGSSKEGPINMCPTLKDSKLCAGRAEQRVEGDKDIVDATSDLAVSTIW